MKQHLAARDKSFDYLDSEPPTPKSVRPPLPSITEAELKAACTWIVANYRPSHIPYEEPIGIGVSVQGAEQVDYAAINAQVRRERAAEAPPATQWPSIPAEEMRVEQNGSQWPSSDMFRYKPTETSKDLFQHDEFEVMREQRNTIMEKADKLMANLEETQKVLLSPEIRSHSRTASNQSALSLSNREGAQSQKGDPRSDSVGTVNSTPRTDITGSTWAGSTAPTSPYVTPAHQSKRASHTQSDNHLPPKVTAVDAEWMRQELEKHLKAQEEETMRQESPVREAAAGLAETTPTQVAQTPTSPTSITRKPVPRRHTGESQKNFSMPTDSRQSKPHSRNQSRPETLPTSPTSVHIPEQPSTGGGQEVKSDRTRAGRGRSITQDIKHAVRPSTAQTAIKTEPEIDRPRSRAQSMKGQVQNFSRPSLDAPTSRKVSLDISRPQSRGRSVDSFRSAVSAISSTVESSAKQWRYPVAGRRSQESERSVELNSARTSDSHRGRPRMPRHSPPPPPRPKPNLNRELPPLPGLDQWKPVEVETTPQDQAITTDDQPPAPQPTTTKPSYPRRQDSLVNRRPARHQPSTSSPTIPTFPSSAARQSVYLDAESYLSSDPPLAPANTRDPSAPAQSPVDQRRNRQSKVLQEDHASPDPHTNGTSQVSLGQISAEPRPPTRQLNSASQVPGGGGGENRHSRTFSSSSTADPAAPTNFSRKLSSSADDDHARMYDQRFARMLEVRPARSPEEDDDGEKRRHWWHGKKGRARGRREENWMDAVVKSGSRSGVLLTDEVAGAPIVRY